MNRRQFLLGTAASVALITVVPSGTTTMNPTRPWFYPLTPRQAQVSELVAAGFSNAEIGASLGITENMSKLHVSYIFRQLALGRRSQIRDWVIKQHQKR